MDFLRRRGGGGNEEAQLNPSNENRSSGLLARSAIAKGFMAKLHRSASSFPGFSFSSRWPRPQTNIQLQRQKEAKLATLATLLHFEVRDGGGGGGEDFI